MKRPVLIVIDMLNDFLAWWSSAARAQLVESCAQLVAIMRAHKLPVIWVRQGFEPDLSDAFAEMRSKGIRTVIRGLSLLQRLPQVSLATHDEVLTFVERHRLMGRGLGWIDAHLLASAALSQTLLWSRDRRLSQVAKQLHLGVEP